MMEMKTMRPAIAMIELIFAIVIIAISVITIPSMMAVANQASKGMSLDADVMARLSGWTLDKFQARWDRNYNASDSGILLLSPNTGDLNCTRNGMYRWGSDENISSMQCNIAANPSAIPNPSLDGNLSKGIEQLNGGNENITVVSASGESYNVNASYAVSYVDAGLVTVNANTATATWKLGSSSNMYPDGSLGAALVDRTNLKRVVTRFDSPDVNITLTFFKSNKGN